MASTADAVSDFSEGLFAAGQLSRDARRVRQLEAAVRQYADAVEAKVTEIEGLRKMLDLPPIPGKTRVAAKILGHFPLENRLTLGVGKEKGVRSGMPVVTADGLLGVVQTADARTCQALLITSPRTQVGAIVRRQPPPEGIIRGESSRVLLLEFLDMKTTIEVGDLVVTSGHSERIPPDIPIGRVLRVETDLDFGSRRCQVFPNVQVGSAREVYVLR